MYELLRSILVEDFELDEGQLRLDADREGAGMDSLVMVELSMLLSKRFAIEISDDELMAVATVGDIAKLMEERSPRP